jgi:uncharacterized NAD(P)/FAD-binding protein YdhS
MSLFNHVGVIGGGPASVYFLEELLEQSGVLRKIDRLTLFERRSSWAITLASRSGCSPRVSGFGTTTGSGDPLAAVRYRSHLSLEALAQATDPATGRIELASILSALLAEYPDGWIRTWQSHPAAAVLRADLASSNFSQRRKRHIPWQALLWEKTDIFRQGAEPALPVRPLDSHGAVAALLPTRSINVCARDSCRIS